MTSEYLSSNTIGGMCVKYLLGILFAVMAVDTNAAIVAEDDFSGAGYNGGFGWSGNWVETATNNPNTGPGCQGNGYINNNRICRHGSEELRFHGVWGSDPFIYREVDLSDPNIETASLIFDLSSTGNLAVFDQFGVQASNDGGTSWATLETYNDDQSLSNVTLDLTPFLSGNTQIRFGVELNVIQNERGYNVDNVRLDVEADLTGDDFIITDPETSIDLAVLDNDDPGADPGSVTFSAQPAGTVSAGGSVLTVPDEGVFTVQPDGSIRFDPESGFFGRTTPVRYEVDVAGSTAAAEIQVLINEHELCEPTGPGNQGFALASPVNTEVHIVEISDPNNPNPDLNPGNTQLLFDHNQIAAQQNGDVDTANDIPYLGTRPSGAPDPDPSVVSNAEIGNGDINSMAVDSANERLYYTSNSGGGENRSVFVYDGPSQRIGRLIVDVTVISLSECPDGSCGDLEISASRGLNDAGGEYHAGRLFLGAENVDGSFDRIYRIDIDEVDSRVNGTFPPTINDTGLLYTFEDADHDWGDLVVKPEVGTTNPDAYYLYSIDRVGGLIYRIAMTDRNGPYELDQVVTASATGQGTITQGEQSFVLEFGYQEIDLDSGSTIGPSVTFSGDWPVGTEAADSTSCVSATSSLPVSLNSFESSLFGARLDVEWTTSSETFNVGFHVWGKLEGDWRRLTDRPVLSKSTDAVTPESYRTRIRVTEFDPRALEGLALSSIETTGAQELYGTFEVGESYGEEALPEPIPWRDISEALNSRMTERGYVKRGRKWYRDSGGNGRRHEYRGARSSYMSAAEKSRRWRAERDQGGDGRLGGRSEDTRPGKVPGAPDGRPESGVNDPDGAPAVSWPVLELAVTEPGMQRVTYSDLRAAGLDLRGVRPGAIAVTLKGEGVPRHIDSRGRGGFGPGDHIDFWGRQPDFPDALYLSDYIYRIEVDAAAALSAGRVSRRVDGGQSRALFPVRVNEDNAYSFVNATADPWHARMLMHPWGPKSYSVSMELDGALLADAPGRVEAVLTGFSDFPEVDPDHRIQLIVNGQVVLEEDVSGHRAVTLTAEVPAGVLAEGENTVEVSLPGGTAAPYDIVTVDRVSLWYPRALATATNALHVEGAITEGGLAAGGFTSRQVAAYATDAGGNLARLNVTRRLDPQWQASLADAVQRFWTLRFQLIFARGDRDERRRLVELIREVRAEFRELLRNRTWQVTVPAVADTPGVEGVEYWLSAPSMVNEPELLGSVMVDEAPLLSEPVDYLVIVHPSFLPAEGEASHPLSRYVERRESQGWRVRLVGLDAIQDVYGGGMALPRAVTGFLKAADGAFDYDHVLLVGDDSYDYQDKLGLGSVSFLPTMYADTNQIHHSPSDGLMTDLDGDGISDKAVGRWPVRTLTDLEVMVRKTLDWESPVTGPRDDRTSVWVTDSADPSVPSFETQAERMIDTLRTPQAGDHGEPWPEDNISRVYFDQVTAQGGRSRAATAREQLMEALAAGQTITGFAGHGSPTDWTFQGLLSSRHVNEMDNEGRPTLITTLTCYTSYFVSPNTDTLAHRLMAGYRVGDDGEPIPGVANGAVAVHGAATLSGYGDNEKLARTALAHQLDDGDTLGEAILKARQAAAAAGQTDTAKNWALLGDPTLTIQP